MFCPPANAKEVGVDLAQELSSLGLLNGKDVSEVVCAFCWYLAALYHSHDIAGVTGLSEGDFATKVNVTLVQKLADARGEDAEDDAAAH